MEKKKTSFLSLFVAVYFTSYLTRTNYAAVLLEIVNSEGFTKESVSLALTLSAVTYGFGQIISGWLGDRLKPEKIILVGLSLASLMNLLVPIYPNTSFMSSVWAVNGFAQAMIWPPLVKIMAGMFDTDTYKKACMWVSWGASLSTVSVYLLSPLLINLFSWKAVFVFSATAGISVSIIWALSIKHLGHRGTQEVKSSPENAKKFSVLAVTVLAVTVVTVALQGLIRDGFTTWTPTLLSEKFSFSSSSAILSGVILPIFSMTSSWFSSFTARKLIKNEYIGAVFFFLLCLIGSLTVGFSQNAILTVFGAALAEGASHGVNYNLTCLVPLRFSEYGKTSLVSGLLNCGTYIGSAFSTSFIATLITSSGWNSVALLWSICALIGAVICIFLYKNKLGAKK